MDLLDNPVRDYPWGSAGDIPEFLGVRAGGGRVAELWMGAHPDSPSLVRRDGRPRSLAEVIAADPEAELGSRVRDAFGPRLPFLLKLISAARPLSLQVHPDRQHARQAYAAQQVTPGADRDYTDDNHKPELVCALRDGFAGLCGFRPLAETADLLAALAVPGLAGFAARLDPADPAGSLRALVTDTLTGPADPALIAAVRAARDARQAESRAGPGDVEQGLHEGLHNGLRQGLHEGLRPGLEPSGPAEPPAHGAGEGSAAPADSRGRWV